MPDGDTGLTLAGGIGNEFLQPLKSNDKFEEFLDKRMGGLMAKADTISQATNLLWYDLRPVVQMMYPYKELIPLISRLPRVSADGGNAYHWKRITGINSNNVSAGVSEGNRGARIAITEQDMVAYYKTLGLESSVTFEARLGGRNLNPETLGISVQANLRALMIQEEQILINGDASLALGTPTLSLSAGAVTNVSGSINGTIYVSVVALTGMAYLDYLPFNATANTGGIQGQVTKINADGSSDTYGGGSSRPSNIGSAGPTGTQAVTCTSSVVAGAVAYAWYAGTSATPSNMFFAGMTPSNRCVLSQYPATTTQPLSNLYVGGLPVDNSVNTLVPDGILTQIYGAIFGPDPGRLMATNSVLPSGITISAGGSIVYPMASGNTGLTIAGSNINEFDAILRAGYEQYKIGYNKILISAADCLDTFGAMLGQGSNSPFKILFDADVETGKIIAGRRVTSYMNKFMGNTLDVIVHPYVPPGTIIFWSDTIPYELAGVPNLLEAHVRQDYYQIQWPWRSRRYEYGVYVDEVFSLYYSPAFALLTNKNPSTGNFVF